MIVGGNPLIWFEKLSSDMQAKIAGKLEFFYPVANVKYRIEVAMIDVVENRI